jgi:hypothetical protein
MQWLFSERWLLASLEGSRFSLLVAIDSVDGAAIGTLFFQPACKQQQCTFKGVVWHILDRKHSDWTFAMVGCHEKWMSLVILGQQGVMTPCLKTYRKSIPRGLWGDWQEHIHLYEINKQINELNDYMKPTQ